MLEVGAPPIHTPVRSLGPRLFPPCHADVACNAVLLPPFRVYNNHVFIIRESNAHGMQVFALEKLREYYGKPSAFVRQLEHDTFYNEVTSSHNVVINEETGFAYLVGTRTCRGGK